MTGHDHRKCMKHFAKISELIDGELDSVAGEKIKAHLEACPECRICLATFSKSVELFRGLGPEPVPESVMESLKVYIKKMGG